MPTFRLFSYSSARPRLIPHEKSARSAARPSGALFAAFLLSISSSQTAVAQSAEPAAVAPATSATIVGDRVGAHADSAAELAALGGRRQTPTRTGADSPVTLDSLIDAAIGTHPVVRSSRFQEDAAREALNAAKLQRWPSPSVQADNSLTKSVTTVGLEQVLWAGGRIEAGVDSAQSTLTARDYEVQESQQTVALRVVDAWQSLQQGAARAAVARELLDRLDSYQQRMQRRVDAQVSPPIELELLTARVAQARVDLQRMEAIVRASKARLDTLIGSSVNAGAVSVVEALGSLADRAASEGRRLAQQPAFDLVHDAPAIQKSKQMAEAAEADARVAGAAKWPEVFMRVQKQVNGALNDTEYRPKSVYFGIRYQPGAGLSSFANERGALKRAEGMQQAAAAAQREAQDAIEADIQEYFSADGRRAALAQSVAATFQVVESYERQFVAGRRSWLEVLNAVRENSDVAGSLVDAQTSLIGTTYRLKIRAGAMPWQAERTAQEGNS